MSLLEVVNLGKHYGELLALEGVSFAVEAGEMFGLLGPNGAGKTTLLSIVSGLSCASRGEVRLQGRAIPASDTLAKRMLGLVPQDLAVYDTLTARENLSFFGELFGLSGRRLRLRCDALLAAVGLDSRANDRVGTFSGGMKRRLNLAAALVHEPKLLLLDEPTVGVDPQSRNLIFEEIRRLNRAGLTVVYTSHYMEEVESLCTRVGIIDHGKLQACDTLPKLLQRLRGSIRCRLAPMRPELRLRLQNLPDCSVRELGEDLLLECAEVKGTLVRLVSLLNELNIELVHLETEEPNLERVFLDLTGRALRD